MAEPYLDTNGRITQWFGKDITPAAQDDPNKAAIRNSSGRIYLEDKEAFSVVVKIGNEEHVVASGIAKADKDKRCSLFIRVRGEADVDIPKPAPIEEIE